MSDSSADEETKSSSVEKICEFLEQREVSADVVDQFRKEKMDLSAIDNCSDATLESMGLTKVGDRLALRGFCNQTSISKTKTRKRGLLEAFLNIRKKPKSSSKASKKDVNRVVIPKLEKKEKTKTKKIQLGWLHFDEKKKKFVSVRLIKGGGTRDVDIPITHTRDDILKLCIQLFFPNGFSEFAGEASALDFRLANFKNEKIEDILHVGEAEVPFTVMNYIRAYQTNKVRLYLTSSLKEKEISTTEDNDEEPALFSIDDEQTQGKSQDIGYEADQEVCFMGSSAQRQQIIEEQNLAYDHSLKCDRAKSEALNKEILDLQRKEELRIERSLRVPREPNLERDAYIIVKVRHVTFGLLTRRFSPTVRMESVFDWVGSQSLEPEFFALCLPCGGPPLSATDPVSKADRQTLSMVETVLNDSNSRPSTTSNVARHSSSIEEVLIDSETALMPSPVLIQDLLSLEEPVILDVPSETENRTDANPSRKTAAAALPTALRPNSTTSEMRKISQEIDQRMRNIVLKRCSANFFSFASTEFHSSRNDDMYSIMTLSDTLNDEFLSSGQSAVGQFRDPSDNEIPTHTPATPPNSRGSYSTLNQRRTTVMHDLIQAFSDEDIMLCEVKVVMVDARGNDEMGLDLKGIYRDAIGCFWQEFYNTCTIGERERVPALRHDFQLSEWTAIARILVKGFWDLEYFPVMLSKAFLVGVIFGESQIAEDILLSSFSRYLAQDEEAVVRQALLESDFSDEFIDLLDRFECRKIPTTENAKSLILEIAHKEIVQKTQYVADCWKGVLQTGFHDSKLSSIEGLRKLFDAIEPTNKKVLCMINHTTAPMSSGEQETIKYLKRFVRGMELTQLKSFLMFVTGADVICVGSIKVDFTKLKGLERRPIAHICGCVLELPSTYDSYTEFRAEFSNVLAKEKWQNDIM